MMDQVDHCDNRRPLASRELHFFQRIASWMARRGVSPNAISVTSVFFALVAGGALFATSHLGEAWMVRAAWLIAATMIQLRLLANMLDGMVAIGSGKASPIGVLYNEVPDRISDPAILVAAGYAVGGNVALGFLAAVTAMFVAYVRAMGAASGAGESFEGPMAKPQRMFLITLVAVYCGLSPIAWQPVHQVTGWGPTAWVLLIIIIGCLFTSIRRLKLIATRIRAGGRVTHNNSAGGSQKTEPCPDRENSTDGD